MASPRLPCTAVLLACIAVASVAAQTFQYSRGWTNGKRDGTRHAVEDARDVASKLEKVLNACQLNKLKYILEGGSLNERIFTPCDYTDDDNDSQNRRRNPKSDRNQDLFDAFL